MEDKLYYDIYEVSRELGETAATLRYWETQFKELRPTRSSKGNRQYKKEDIELLRRIIYLSRSCGYTLDGVRDQLRADRRNLTKEKVIADLQEVRDYLHSIKEEL